MSETAEQTEDQGNKRRAAASRRKRKIHRICDAFRAAGLEPQLLLDDEVGDFRDCLREAGEQEARDAPLMAVVVAVKWHMAHVLRCRATCGQKSDFEQHVTNDCANQIAGWSPDEYELKELRTLMEGGSDTEDERW